MCHPASRAEVGSHFKGDVHVQGCLKGVIGGITLIRCFQGGTHDGVHHALWSQAACEGPTPRDRGYLHQSQTHPGSGPGLCW